MKAIIETKNQTAVIDIRSVEYGVVMLLKCGSEEISSAGFGRLRSMGVNCAHSGETSPVGAAIMLNVAVKPNYNLKIVES